jgi:hypothetical protein
MNTVIRLLAKTGILQTDIDYDRNFELKPMVDREKFPRGKDFRRRTRLTKSSSCFLLKWRSIPAVVSAGTRKRCHGRFRARACAAAPARESSTGWSSQVPSKLSMLVKSALGLSLGSVSPFTM